MTTDQTQPLTAAWAQATVEAFYAAERTPREHSRGETIDLSDLTEQQIAFLTEAGYTYPHFAHMGDDPSPAKVGARVSADGGDYSYQPGSGDEPWTADIYLVPDGYVDHFWESLSRPIVRLGSASVGQRDSEVILKCYSATGARDSDHDVARTGHIVIHHTTPMALSSFGVELSFTGYMREGKIYRTGEDVEVETSEDGETILCGLCTEQPHGWAEHWLPNRNLAKHPTRVGVKLRARGA